jgi:hypothetical protein
MEHLDKESEENMKELRSDIAKILGVAEEAAGELLDIEQRIICLGTEYFMDQIRSKLKDFVTTPVGSCEKDLSKVIGAKLSLHLMMNVGINLLIRCKQFGIEEKDLKLAFEDAMKVKKIEKTTVKYF